MRSITEILVHCSDSPFGDAAQINEWHKARALGGEPWSVAASGLYIGYHYVILNGKRHPNLYEVAGDGLVEKGRALEERGCHCVGHNTASVGICLVSQNGLFTMAQARKLAFLVSDLRKQFSVPIDRVFGHNQFSSKSCPGFEIENLRGLLMLT